MVCGYGFGGGLPIPDPDGRRTCVLTSAPSPSGGERRAEDRHLWDAAPSHSWSNVGGAHEDA